MCPKCFSSYNFPLSIYSVLLPNAPLGTIRINDDDDDMQHQACVLLVFLSIVCLNVLDREFKLGGHFLNLKSLRLPETKLSDTCAKEFFSLRYNFGIAAYRWFPELSRELSCTFISSSPLVFKFQTSHFYSWKSTGNFTCRYSQTNTFIRQLNSRLSSIPIDSSF